MRKATSVTALVTLFAIVLALVASPLVGQEKPKETGPGWITQSFKVQHVELDRLRDLFWNLPGSTRVDDELGLLIAHAPEQTMQFIQETIAKLDVPSLEAPQKPTVEITGYLLGAGRQPAEAEDVAMMPLALQPVVKELQEKFPYGSYRVLDSTIIRVRAHESGQTQGLIPNFLPEPLSAHTARYDLIVALGGITPSGDRRGIELRQVQLQGRIPIVVSPAGTPPQQVTTNHADFRINTAMDIREGETVVVGKAGVQGAVDGIFLVLKAKVVD